MRSRLSRSFTSRHPEGKPPGGALSGLIPLLARTITALCAEPRLAGAVSAAVLEEACRGRSRGAIDGVALVRIVRSAHNRMADDVRPDEQRTAEDGSRPSSPFPEGDPAAPLRTALGALPPARRLAVQLVDVEDFSYREAAAALELPVDEFEEELHAARLVLLPALGAGPQSRGSRFTLRR